MEDSIVQKEGIVTAYDKIWVALLFCVSCTAVGDKLEIVEAPSETVCTILQDSLQVPLQRLNSICIIDSAHFALCTENQVYLYGMNGKCIREIGASGSAGNEYNMPMVVRSDGNLIYVWSAMELRFLVYDLEGRFIDEYPYASAVRDFRPDSCRISIYPAGSRSDHVIDVYDKRAKEVVKSLYESSYSHRVLSGWMSAAPMLCRDNELYFIPQDDMEVMKYDFGTLTIECTASLKSDSFIPERLEQELNTSIKERDYRYSNPYTLAVWMNGEDLYVLASEGEYIMEEDHLSNKNRHCSLYRHSKGNGERIMSFGMDSFGYTNLLSVYGEAIYFISHTIKDNEDIYTLKRLLYYQ